MAKKSKGNLLESLLRYEIILALFTLIGVYYFFTFSPVRMPRKTITSPTIELSSPPAISAKSPDATISRSTEKKPEPPVSAPHPPEVKVMVEKNPVGMEKESPTPPAIPPIQEKTAVVTPIEPTTTTAGTCNKAAAGKKTAKPERQQQLPAAKPVGNPVAQASATTTVPAIAGQKSPMDKQSTKTKQSTIVKPPAARKVAATPGEKAYVIQVGIFIFPETLKNYQQILQDHGYASFVTTRKRLLPMHRVFLGPYPTLASARKIIRTIDKWGDDPFPCRRGNQFYVNVGSFYYQTTAREKISQYRSRKFTPVVFHEPVNVPHHILLVDGFSFNHYPRSALRSIKQLGIPDAFVRNWQP